MNNMTLELLWAELVKAGTTAEDVTKAKTMLKTGSFEETDGDIIEVSSALFICCKSLKLYLNSGCCEHFNE